MTMPTFGTALRGFRIGFCYSPRLRCYVRITPHGVGATVELADGAGVMAAQARKGVLHTCWWQRPEVLWSIDTLRGVKNVRLKRIVSFDVDDDGRRR